MLLEQYGRFKKAELEESPFRCLLDTNIEINPHQIIAFCAAIQALKTGGIVLADEVGLGKTIEAGLTLKYVLDSGAKRVLIALPATLRKQWEVELEEKFNLKTIILDRLTVESNLSFWKACLENRDEVRIVITSYDYSSKLMQRFSNVKWDFIIIDEAHNLRNVFHGTKRAKRLYELSKGIPKILLTATPLQNSLSDLHGLISFIDPRIFGSEKVFNKRFIEGQDYTELKRELIPVLYRTLRRDVGKYMDFKKRECRTIDFVLSPDEVELYMRVNNFLKKDVLYSIPNANKGLIVLVIRKLLASSSYALIETFEVLKNRLQKLYEGTKSANAQDGFDLFWNFVEDEIDESGFEEIDDEDTLFQKQQIQAEIDEVDAIIETASRIGRCHRYGQKYDVVAINLLNTGNEADRRVYEILSKKFELFDGVFGASDIALGALESGTSFEKTILEIYQNCGTRAEFKKAFDRLDRQLDAKRNKKAVQLRSILMTESDAAKGAALEKTKNDIDQYLQQVDFWTQVAEPDVEGNLNYWKIDNWGERTFGSHGTLFVGAFCNSNNEMLFPVLLLCDEQGRYIDFTENDIVQALENVNDDDVRYFKPTDEELASYRNIYDTLVQEMLSKYQASSKPVMDYNKRKVENWADIQREQLNIQIAEMNAEIDELSAEATAVKDFLEKVDIRKKVDEKKKQLQKVQTSFHQKVSSIQEEAEREIAEFNQQFDIQPILLVNVVLKF